MADYAKLTIGILAIQGDFERHTCQVSLVGATPKLVKLPRDLEQIHALILPGGESTTMSIMLDRHELRSALLEFGKSLPVYGTCAGMIMLAKDIKDNQAGVEPLGLMDIDVVRMGYGRQVFSFEDNLKANLNGTVANLKATFIRAPMITRVGHSVQTLAEYDGVPVLVTEKNLMASSFHTELDDDTTLLRYFRQRFFQV